jgi:hypothetical protein
MGTPGTLFNPECASGGYDHSLSSPRCGCGQGGIRTPGTFRYTRFPGVHNRPLCHLSREGRCSLSPPPPADKTGFARNTRLPTGTVGLHFHPRVRNFPHG